MSRTFHRHCFGDAQAGAVTKHQYGAMLENADVLKELGDLAGPM
jgi:hypothetical protein